MLNKMQVAVLSFKDDHISKMFIEQQLEASVFLLLTLYWLFFLTKQLLQQNVSIISSSLSTR